jgi:hypothetical protein
VIRQNRPPVCAHPPRANGWCVSWWWADPLALSKPLVTDPRDAGGKLDLRAARRIGQDRRCLVTISTWGSWSSTILEGANYAPGKKKLLVLYDLNGDNKAERLCSGVRKPLLIYERLAS